MEITVQEVIDTLFEPIGMKENTVDTLKFGDPNNPVKGIVTTFMVTQNVLEFAKSIGANLIITHEGICFNHHDSFERFVENDPVWQEKLQHIQDSGMNIFRFHDYWHSYRPDGITVGLVEALGWNSYINEHHPTYSVVTLPPMTVQRIAEHIKKKLGIAYVRVAGNLSLNCKRIGILTGYRGSGEIVIPLYEKENLDLVLYGEGPEWETPEYVRDAFHQGKQKALIVLGHAESEEPGMKALANQLKHLFPKIPVRFVPESQIFQVI